MAGKAAAAEAAMTEATTAEASMATAKAAAPMTTATASSAATRRRRVNHRHAGQRGRGKARNQQFCHHRTLLARIGPALAILIRCWPHIVSECGSRNRSQAWKGAD
jgi:hypothetical protein